MTDTLTQADLAHFTGSEKWYKWSPLFPKVVLTEGTRYVAEKGQAYWLMDIIASVQLENHVKKHEFQVWTLKTEGSKGIVTCEDGNSNIIYTQNIEYTDFPLPEIRFYFAPGGPEGTWVIMLPSEY